MIADLLHDTNFWVAISFVIFIGIALKYGKAAALKSLDDGIDLIKKELIQAETLRVDAQELLAEYQRKHKDAMSEADTIIAQAKKHAEEIRLKAEADMEKTQARRELQLDEKLVRIEQNARREIESYTAKIAIDAARNILSQNIDAKTDKIIIDNSLDTITKTIN